MNNFNKDLKAEGELGKYLDKYFYKQYSMLTNVKRITKQNQQYAGIDVAANYQNQEICIDEKGYLSISKPGKTFALELSYLNKYNERKIGWLFDNTKQTTHYLFCWNKRDENVDHKDVIEKDFHYITAMFIDRNKLLNYLDSNYNINIDTSISTVKNILSSGQAGSLHTIGDNTKSKYFYSTQLLEQPINIVMDKNELEHICDDYFLIKRSELKSIKR